MLKERHYWYLRGDTAETWEIYCTILRDTLGTLGIKGEILKALKVLTRDTLGFYGEAQRPIKQRHRRYLR